MSKHLCQMQGIRKETSPRAHGTDPTTSSGGPGQKTSWGRWWATPGTTRNGSLRNSQDDSAFDDRGITLKSINGERSQDRVHGTGKDGGGQHLPDRGRARIAVRPTGRHPQVWEARVRSDQRPKVGRCMDEP